MAGMSDVSAKALNRVSERGLTAAIHWPVRA